MYGSWERALTSGSKTPCQELQKKSTPSLMVRAALAALLLITTSAAAASPVATVPIEVTTPYSSKHP